MVLILGVDGLYDGGKRLLHAAEKIFFEINTGHRAEPRPLSH